MVTGDRQLCSNWSDGYTFVRGETLERVYGTRPVSLPPPGGPARLEAGTSLVVLARVVDGRLERIRTIGDDCPVDAGGATIRWLTGTGVSPSASVRFLDELTRAAALNVSTNRRLAEAAISAIGLHQDPSALPVLDRLSSPATTDGSLRRQAVSGLATHRGAAGFDRVVALIKGERNRDLRRSFVSSLAQSPHERTADVLLEIARTDADAGVRGEAVARYIRRAGQPALATALSILDTDPDDEVRRRIVSGIGTLPEPVAAPALVRLARSHPSVVVRKEAVASLGRFNDPQARALLEELLR
jgi:HEAT repeat protein